MAACGRVKMLAQLEELVTAAVAVDLSLFPCWKWLGLEVQTIRVIIVKSAVCCWQVMAQGLVDQMLIPFGIGWISRFWWLLSPCAVAPGGHVLPCCKQ